MSSNYKHGETPLNDIYATTHSSLKSDLLFNIADYGFSDTSDTIFVKRGTNILSGWGTTAEVVRYAKDNNPLPFCCKESCPVPKYHTSGDHYIALDGSIYTSSQYVRYNSSTGYCERSGDKSSWSKIGAGFNSIFVALQGAGGGGAGGAYTNVGVTADCKGAGGGGGGAFVLCHLNLKAVPNTIVELIPGQGGSGGDGGYGTSSSGSDGGSSTLCVNSTIYLEVPGGKGGEGVWSSGNDMSNGGGGGTAPTSCSLSYVTILQYYDGKGGGDGGDYNFYAVGIPGGKKDGKAGSSFINTDSINVPILNVSLPVVRKGSTWTTSYTSGCGQPAYNSSGGAYSSGGGGGGASVMGQFNTSSPYKLYGYGIGGGGGTATTGGGDKGGAGKSGCIFISSCTKI